jgi:hypothetical protein
MADCDRQNAYLSQPEGDKLPPLGFTNKKHKRTKGTQGEGKVEVSLPCLFCVLCPFVFFVVNLPELGGVAGSTGKLELFDIFQYFFGIPFIPAINLEHFAVRRDESGAQTVNHLALLRPIVQTEKAGYFLDLLRTA